MIKKKVRLFRYVVLAFVASAATPMFALGTSPYAALFQDISNEATAIWAIAASGAGLVVGLIGCLFGEHNVKSWAVKAVVVCGGLLSVQGLLAWL